MTALIASDLDRTLIYSRGFLSSEQADAEVVEVYDGRATSFMTAKAAAQLRSLAARVLVIPATTRTIAQYRRVTLPGEPYRHAVTSNGGVILVDGVPDSEWSRSVGVRLTSDSQPLDDIVTALREHISDQWVLNLRTADDLFCYLVVDEVAMPHDFVVQWQEWCRPHGWEVSRQGRKVYTVPLALNKSHAVAEIRRRLVEAYDLSAEAPLLAAGDGALDADLLEAADEAIRPAHGELHSMGWQSPRTTVTATAGAAAAKEILDWFAARIP